VNVRANGSYQIQKTGRGPNGNFTFYTAQFDVTEAQVVGEDPSPVEVTVNQSQPDLSGGTSSGSDGEGSGDSEQNSDDGESGSGEESSQSDESSEERSNAIAPVTRMNSIIHQLQTAP
jgi:hypothetical protein